MANQTTVLKCIKGEMNEDNRLKKNLPFAQTKGIKLLWEKIIELRMKYSQLTRKELQAVIAAL